MHSGRLLFWKADINYSANSGCSDCGAGVPLSSWPCETQWTDFTTGCNTKTKCIYLAAHSTALQNKCPLKRVLLQSRVLTIPILPSCSRLPLQLSPRRHAECFQAKMGTFLL